MPKMCKFDSSKRCYWGCCSSLDSMGNVVVCCLVPNPSGSFMRKKLCGSPRSFHVFNKHLHGGS
jgi:hypothetical protein